MKVFRTYNEFMRHYFPKELEREQEEERQAEIDRDIYLRIEGSDV